MPIRKEDDQVERARLIDRLELSVGHVQRRGRSGIAATLHAADRRRQGRDIGIEVQGGRIGQIGAICERYQSNLIPAIGEIADEVLRGGDHGAAHARELHELDRSITRIMTTSRREACPCAATVDPVWPRSRMNVSGTVTLACMVTVRVLYAVCATVVVSDRLVVLQYPVGKLALKKDWAVAVALAV